LPYSIAGLGGSIATDPFLWGSIAGADRWYFHWSGAAMQHNHRTKAGVWGRLIILEGRLRYCLEDGSGRSWMLDSDTPAWIPPDLPHRVEFIGPVRFYVSFWH